MSTTNDHRSTLGVGLEQGLSTENHPAFVEYYARESLSDATLQRYTRIRDALLQALGPSNRHLRVGDIGCGAGAQCQLWTGLGHTVFAVDISEPLIQIARERAAAQGISIRFEVASATKLPWSDASMDVCIMPELLEHVADWQACLSECQRVLAPNGLLYLSTTNKLCPLQQEFNLPLYSWYPGFLKRRYEQLAVTTRREIANHATYPAVNWFSFYMLRDHLEGLGFDCMDRFDIIAARRGEKAGVVLRALRTFPILRFFGHVLTPSTTVIARRREMVQAPH